MVKTRDEVLVEALERCIAESGETALNQYRYAKWRETLPNRREVPVQFAFGNAAEFVALCKANDIPIVKRGRLSSLWVYHCSPLSGWQRRLPSRFRPTCALHLSTQPRCTS